MRQYILFFIIFLSRNLAFGQTSMTTTFHTERIEIGQKIVTQYITSITNDTSQDQWLFFEPDTLISDQTMIDNRFLSKQLSGMTLFNMIMDEANWSDFAPNIEFSFVKIIRPAETFTIIALDSDTNNFFVNSLRIIPQEEIKKLRSFLLQMTDATSPIIYKSSVLVIP